MLIQAAAAAVVADVETYRIGRYTHWKHTHTAYINISIYTRAGTLYPSCVYYTYIWYARLFFYMLSRSLALYTVINNFTNEQCALVPYTHFFSFRFDSLLSFFFVVLFLFRSLSRYLTLTAYIPHLLPSAAIHSVLFAHTHSVRLFSSLFVIIFIHIQLCEYSGLLIIMTSVVGILCSIFIFNNITFYGPLYFHHLIHSETLRWIDTQKWNPTNQARSVNSYI